MGRARSAGKDRLGATRFEGCEPSVDFNTLANIFLATTLPDVHNDCCVVGDRQDAPLEIGGCDWHHHEG